MIADHLWQSTWFALAAGVLAFLVRRDAAKVRYWVWFAASLKFMIPFPALTWIGSQFVFQVTDDHAFLPLVQNVAAPLTMAISIDAVASVSSRWLIALWLLGSLVILARWLRHWLHARALVAHSTRCDLRVGVPVYESRFILEPCVVGLHRPVLLLPMDLTTTLSRGQLDSVIAHELWHVRRRDNLTASIHQAILALFWFHPLVWWIGRKLIETREHACDEGAVADGLERAAYAEALLRVCRHSVESRMACVARAAGGDLTARIRSIMTARPAARWWLAQRTLLATLLLVCFALPVTAGMNVVAVSKLHVAAGARSIRIAEGGGPAFVNADGDHVYARNVSLRELIGESHGLRARDVLGRYRWLDHPRYDIDLRAGDGVRNPPELVAELLREQFNIELVVSPTPRAF